MSPAPGRPRTAAIRAGRRTHRATRRPPAGTAALSALLGLASIPTGAAADEGGVSFWAPGLYGSLAAVPVDPGWSWATVYYHTSADAGAARTFLRGGRFESGLSARGDAAFFGPTYTFATPVLGAQAAFSLLGVGATSTPPWTRRWPGRAATRSRARGATPAPSSATSTPS
ncbi:hypothetical protein [Dankookia sp. P2]|uniref:hypothetical protein n=1 Tax=Dankookia sp. P2 TaxID=3423955 RepID=UPI003D66596A